MTRPGARLLVLFATLALGACAAGPRFGAPEAERAAIAARMSADINVLSSEEFGGRKPGTPGEEQTVAFLIKRMQEAGLVSGTNDPGSAWRAPVAMVSTNALESKITVRTKRGEFVLEEGEATAFSATRRALIDGAEVVFIGSEVTSVPAEAIEGRIVVRLGSPTYTSGARDQLFAAAPAAILTVVDDAAAVQAARTAFGGEKLKLAAEDTTRLSAFVTSDAMERAFPRGVWQKLLDAAQDDDFKPQTLEATIAIDTRSARREFNTSNIIGLLPGAVRGSGAVILMGHWDHLGECAPGAPDPVCNGAIDNASGLAAMIELAQRLKASGPHDRDIYFLATSAEEAGLLGARAFAARPPMPLEEIVGVFNFDMAALAPQGTPVGFVGEGETPLDEIVLATVAEGGRQLGDRELASRYLLRQDGWALLEAGIPAVLISTTFGSAAVLEPFLDRTYHKPGDDGSVMELGGAIDDILLHQELVRRVASTAIYNPPPGDGVVIVEPQP